MAKLLIIDPQMDFMDTPTAALPVKGALEDMRRLANFINENGDSISDIMVTLDTHNLVDIAHPAWWVRKNGDLVAPFTTITPAAFERGEFVARDKSMQQISAQYIKRLEENDKANLMVWPPHCLIGTEGNNVEAGLMRALNAWADNKATQVKFVIKGMDPRTEHYSAVRPEVSFEKSINEELIAFASDELLIAGEALSHCVNGTVRDLVSAFGCDASKMTLLMDCTSSVEGFKDASEAFLKDMMAVGMKTRLVVETN